MPTSKPRIGLTIEEHTYDWILNASTAHGMSLSEFVDQEIRQILARDFAEYSPTIKNNVRAMHARTRKATARKKAVNNTWNFV